MAGYLMKYACKNCGMHTTVSFPLGEACPLTGVVRSGLGYLRCLHCGLGDFTKLEAVREKKLPLNPPACEVTSRILAQRRAVDSRMRLEILQALKVIVQALLHEK